MSETKTVTIVQVSRKDRVSQRTGKPFTSLGLKTTEYGDRWLSGFDNAQTHNWKAGDRVEIIVEEKGEYLNFSLPKDSGPAASTPGLAEIKNILILKIEPKLTKILEEIDTLKGLNPDAMDKAFEDAIENDEPMTRDEWKNNGV